MMIKPAKISDVFLVMFVTLVVRIICGILIAILRQNENGIDGRGRADRAPAAADPPAPPNANETGTNTDSTTANAPDAIVGTNADNTDNAETEANNTEVEKLKAAINAALEELMCPITFELPGDPVFTEAGDVCDREAITALIRQRGMRTLRSMRTNQPMGRRIASSVAIRNVIEKLVESGAADEDVATAWRSARESLEEGRRNDAELPRREHNAGWFGFGAFGQFMVPEEQQEAVVERLQRQIAELEQRWEGGN